MNGYTENGKTFVAGEALAKFRRVKLSSSTVVYADAGEDSIGVTMENAASGAPVQVKLWNDGGTFLVESAGAITAEADVYGANDGKIDDAVSGEKQGIAVEAATGSGQYIEILAATPAGVTDIQAHIADVAAVTQDALTLTSMTGTGNTTPAAETNIDTLGGSLTGTLDNTLADIGNTTSVDGSAAVNKNFKEVQAELVTQRALNAVLVNNCKTFATHLNAARVDNASQVTKINAIIAALESAGILLSA